MTSTGAGASAREYQPFPERPHRNSAAAGDEFVAAVGRDPRFLVDDVPALSLIQHALPLGWTSDPFDRLLAAHSMTHRKPLCSVDVQIRKHHRYLPAELVV